MNHNQNETCTPESDTKNNATSPKNEQMTIVAREFIDNVKNP